MSKKRVLLIAEATGGGVRRHLLDLIEGLDTELFSLGLVYGTERADSRFVDALPRLSGRIELFPLPSLGRELCLTRDVTAFCGIIRAIRAFRPDVVHCHSSKAGALGRVAARLCGVGQILYTPHAYSFQSPSLSKKKKAVYRMIEGGLGRFFTDGTLNVSKGERDFALQAKLGRPERFHVVYNGVEDLPQEQKPLRLHALLGVSPETRLIGCAARIDEQKDPTTFLEIVRLTAHLPNLCYVWIGDGPQAQALAEQRDALGLQNRLFLPGYLPDADLLVGELDDYLSTALYEGMPYAPIEALRAGTPMIATDVTGNNEIALPNKSGLLFPAQNAREGARIIEAELLSPVLSREEARAVFLERFSLAAMLNAIKTLYLS